MKKGFRSFLLLALFSAFMALAFSACSNNSKDDSNLTRITLNEVVRSVFYAPQYAAIELGFFADEGIEIHLETGNGADRTMTALISGDAHIGLMGTEAGIYVFNEGRQDHAIAFAQLTQRAGNFLVAREPMTDFTWDDVRGRTIIGGRIGGMPQMVLEFILDMHGIVPGVDVEIITNLQFTTTAGAFVGGIGDFTAEFDPSALEIEKSGAGFVVAGLANYTDPIPYTVYMANGSFISENPELIQRFTNAVYRGQCWINESTSEDIARVISPFFPHSDIEDLAFIVNRYASQNTWTANPAIPAEGFYLLQDIMEHGGELAAHVPFEILVDNSFAERAISFAD
ncbi:MAG: ABC transporter substrate-binding protein [Defluviitaleaceae bacterium]|nr:ABC transporter substrate-binding protein [Defluviitaleaceae bacterium]